MSEEVTGRLASGNQVRVQKYLLEVTRPSGELVRELAPQDIAEVRREGTAVTLTQFSRDELKLTFASLQDAVAVEAALRDARRATMAPRYELRVKTYSTDREYQEDAPLMGARGWNVIDTAVLYQRMGRALYLILLVLFWAPRPQIVVTYSRPMEL
jgi:hypothetical protein